MEEQPTGEERKTEEKTAGQEKRSGREALWRNRIEHQAQSGLTVRAFCQREGVAEHSFYQWRRKFASSAPSAVNLLAPHFKLPQGSFSVVKPPQENSHSPDSVRSLPLAGR